MGPVAMGGQGSLDGVRPWAPVVLDDSGPTPAQVLGPDAIMGYHGN